MKKWCILIIIIISVLTGLWGFPYTEDEGPFQGLALLFPEYNGDDTLYLTLDNTAVQAGNVELTFKMGDKATLTVIQPLDKDNYFDFVITTRDLPLKFEVRLGIDETIEISTTPNLVITFMKNTPLKLKNNDMFPPFIIKRGSVIAIWPESIE